MFTFCVKVRYSCTSGNNRSTVNAEGKPTVTPGHVLVVCYARYAIGFQVTIATKLTNYVGLYEIGCF